MAHRFTFILAFALLLASCSTTKRQSIEHQSSTLTLDSTLWLRHLASITDIEGTITLETYPLNTDLGLPSTAESVSSSPSYHASPYSQYSISPYSSSLHVSPASLSFHSFPSLSSHPSFNPYSHPSFNPYSASHVSSSPSSPSHATASRTIITIDLHAHRADTLAESTTSKHRAESTITGEVEQLTTRTDKTSSWRLSFRFRAILSIFLLSLPFAIIGFLRFRRVFSAKLE